MNKFASFLLYIIYVHSQSVAFNLIHFTICCRWDDLEFRTFTIAILTVVLFYILLHVDVVIIIIARIKKGFNTLLLSKLFLFRTWTSVLIVGIYLQVFWTSDDLSHTWIIVLHESLKIIWSNISKWRCKWTRYWRVEFKHMQSNVWFYATVKCIVRERVSEREINVTCAKSTLEAIKAEKFIFF